MMSRILSLSVMVSGLMLLSSVVEAESIVLQVSIRGDESARATKVVRAKQGDHVAIEWSTDRPVTVHIHPYEIEQELTPGARSRSEFIADISGRFPIEAHFASRAGKRIVAYLEVLPR